MEDDLLKRYKKVFSLNGGMTLRDLYVLETDGQDWHSILPFLHTCSYTVEFLMDGEQRPLPQRVEDLFALTQNHPLIRIDREHLTVHCSCFAEDGLEFNIAAEDFQDETTIREQVSRLLDFIRTIGQVLNKVITLAPEGSPHFPLFRFDPGTKEEHWFLENFDAVE